MLGAMVRLAEERPVGRPTVVMACTVNEESGFSGVAAVPKLWSEPGGFIPRRPDAAIVAEPTSLQVVVAHKGVLRWRIHTRGRAAHSSRPEQGDNAIYRMAEVVLVLKRYHAETLAAHGVHPLCGPATLSVGTIRGGSGVNTIPDQATVEIDRRLRPDEDPMQAYRHAVAHLAERLGADFPLEHEPPSMEGPPLSDEHNGPLADRLAGEAAARTGPCDRIGVPYATNAAWLALAGVPTVVFGPGSIQQAHTADEWIALDQLELAADILYRFVSRYQ